jgi:hypothetical protein
MQELEKHLSKKIPIFSIGNPGDLTYEYEIIGRRLMILKKLLKRT